MGPLESYTPKSIRHLSLTVPRKKEKLIPKSDRVILLRPNYTLEPSVMALLGTRMLDLRPPLVTSTALSNRDFITILVYITEGITHMDASVFVHNPSYPQSAQNPKHLINTEITCYTEIIPLIDAAMTTVLKNLLTDPRGIWP